MLASRASMLASRAEEIHELMWERIATITEEDFKHKYTTIIEMKEDVLTSLLRENKISKDEWVLICDSSHCAACLWTDSFGDSCFDCPIAKYAGPCTAIGSAFSFLEDSFTTRNYTDFIEYATVIFTAWEENV